MRQNFLIKKNLAKEATSQAIGELRGEAKIWRKAHAQLLAEAQEIKAKLEAEETIVELLKKLVQMEELLVQLLARKLRKNSKNNLELKLINVIFKFNLQFEQLAWLMFR